jgi:hypothetical protein
MKKSEENKSTASSAGPTVKQMGRTAHFGTMGTYTSKGRQERQINGHVILFLLFMSIVSGLKIVSDTIPWQRQQNYDGSKFCVTLGPIWVGSEALFWPKMQWCGNLQQ